MQIIYKDQVIDNPLYHYLCYVHRIGSSKGITKYCFEHVHEGCTMVSVGRNTKTEQNIDSNSTDFQGNSIFLK